MKLRHKILSTAIAVATFAASANTSHAVPVVDGDILIGFSLNQAAAHDTYIFNLGQASVWRENTTPLISIGNIGADLTTAFGSNWMNEPLLRWGIIGGLDQAAGTINGDLIRTVYESRLVATFGTLSGAWTTTSGNHGSLTNPMQSFQEGSHNAGTPGANTTGAFVNTSSATDFNQFIPPTTGTYFAIGNNLLDQFEVGNPLGLGTGGYQIEGALDLWRIANTTAGADLTSGFGTGNIVARTGQYVGTFTIDDTGQLRLDVVPEPATSVLFGVSAMALASVRRRRRNP